MGLQVDEVASGVWHARGAHVGWMLVVDGDAVTLVDTGYPGDRAAVTASLEHVGRNPGDVAAVLLTHAHPDHLGSAEHLRTSSPAPVLVHAREQQHARGEVIEQVSIPTLLGMAWRRDVRQWLVDIVRLDAPKAERLRVVETFDDGPLDVPGQPVATHAPGHTSGHCVFQFADRGVLHLGDAMMTAHHLSRRTGPQPAMDFFDADHHQALESLRTLSSIPAEVVVPGHGPAFHGSPERAVRLALGAR